MPGLIGIVSDQNNNNNIEKLLSKMCQSIKHEEWHKIDSHISKSAGLGRVHLSIFNPEPQPIFNEDQTLCILMDGEIYDYENLKQELIHKGHNFSINNDPEFILHLYEEYGNDIVHKLNGSFTLVIWNEILRKLIIINDRFGIRPLYFSENNGRLLFGSEVKAILQDETFQRIIDDRSVADFFSFGYILGNKTFFRGIELLPPASIMTYYSGRISIEQYWDLDFKEEYEDIPEGYYIDNLSRSILQSVERQMKGNHRIGIPLSGGLDSRTIVASIQKKHYPIHTFTFGKPDSNDVKFAHMMANKLGTIHHFFELKPDDLINNAEKAVYLTDGMQNCIHAHRMQTYSEMREFIDVALSGWIGDSTIAIPRYDYTNPEDNLEIFRRTVFNIPMDLIRNLFNDDYVSLFEKNLELSYNYVLKKGEHVNNKLPDNRLIYYNLKERQRRFSSMGLVLVRNSLEVRTPFSDYDLINLDLNIPLIFKFNKRIYIKLILAAYPILKNVPYQRTGFPLGGSRFQRATYYLLNRCKDNINNRMKRYLGFKVFAETKDFYDYNNWMRNNKQLKEYILNILFDERAMNRPYFDQTHIKEILELHMNGNKDYSELIGRLLTFELWNRQFIDNCSSINGIIKEK